MRNNNISLDTEIKLQIDLKSKLLLELIANGLTNGDVGYLITRDEDWISRVCIADGLNVEEYFDYYYRNIGIYPERRLEYNGK